MVIVVLVVLFPEFRENTNSEVQKNASSPRSRIQVWSSNETDRFWDVRKAQGQRSQRSAGQPQGTIGKSWATLSLFAGLSSHPWND